MSAMNCNIPVGALSLLCILEQGGGGERERGGEGGRCKAVIAVNVAT